MILNSNCIRLLFTAIFILFFCEIGTCQINDSFDFKAVIVGAQFEPVEGAYVKNFRSGKFAVSDNTGLISIECFAQDSLLINALGYEMKILRLEEQSGTYIKLNQITHQLKQLNVYDLKGWEAFKKDFIELELPVEKVNTKGLPQARPSLKPAELRNTFNENPGPIHFIIHPVSSFMYYFNEKEKQKRRVWSMMQQDIRETTYWHVMNGDTIQKLLDVPDSLLVGFILYCNLHIEDKSLSKEYYYKEKISQLYPLFLEERKKRQ
jgi:hypothetical protein